MHRRTSALSLAAAVALLGILPGTAAASEETLKVFESCWQTVRQRFYDPGLHGVDWSEVRERYRPLADGARPGFELHAVLNAMLEELKASHAAVLPGDVYRHMMQELNAQATVTFGLLLEEAIPGRWFVRCAYEGGPAEHAGLMRGDEIVRIDGQPAPSSPWVIAAGYDATSPGGSLCMLGAVEGRELEIVLRRSPTGPLRTVHVRPRKMSSLDAAENSVAVVPLEGLHVGVVHVWYCARDSDDVLRDALEGPLRDCDALVVDLRGRGGYLHVAQRILEIFQPRQGRPPRWNRPAVFLIDGRTRSAKEVMAHVIQRDGLGTLVGERTEGAVLGAGFFPLPDGSYLELPIQDVPVGDVRLEGVGVEPEVRVVAALPYAAGRDPILEQGCEIALRAARGENATVVYEGSY